MTDSLFLSVAEAVLGAIEDYAEFDASRSARRYLASRLIGYQFPMLSRAHVSYAIEGCRRYELEPSDIHAVVDLLVSTHRASLEQGGRTLERKGGPFELVHDLCPNCQSWIGPRRRPEGDSGVWLRSLGFGPKSLDTLLRVDGILWRQALACTAEVLKTGPTEYHDPMKGYEDNLRNLYARPLQFQREDDTVMVATIETQGGRIENVYYVDDKRIDTLRGVEALNALAAKLVAHHRSAIASKLGRPSSRLRATSSTPNASLKIFQAHVGAPLDELSMRIVAECDPLPIPKQPKRRQR